MKLNDTELAYAAGFFDGEGSVTIYKQNNKEIAICVSATQTKEDVIKWFKGCFGGGISYRPPEKSPIRKDGTLARPVWIWSAHGYNAVSFIVEVRRYLKVKLDECDIALECMKEWQEVFLKGFSLDEIVKMYRDDQNDARNDYR